MIQVTTDDLYAEACRALGESIVRERILTAELQRRDALVGQPLGDEGVTAGGRAEPEPVGPDDLGT